MIALFGDVRGTARRWALHACAAATVRAHVDERALARLGPDGVVVLNLHSVSPRTASLSTPVSPQVLDQLLTWLVRHCRVGTLQALEAPTGDDRPLAVLTFDDGYRDFLEFA